MSKAKKKVEVLGPQVGYTDLLDEAMRSKIEQEFVAPRSYNPLRPSAAGHCSRKLAYELMEYRFGWKYDKFEKKTPELQRLFDLGHSVEYSAVRAFEKVPGFRLKYKQQVVSLFDIPRGSGQKELVEGSMDWVFWSDEHRAIADCKSKKDGHYNKFKTRWKQDCEDLRKMKSSHVLSDTAIWVENLSEFIKELDGDYLIDNLLQLNLYACSDFCVERGIDHCVIYRYNKNTSQHFEIRFKPSKKVSNDIKEKFSRISLAVDAQDPDSVLPDHELGSMRAAYCPCSVYTYETDAKRAFYAKKREKDQLKEAKKRKKENE